MRREWLASFLSRKTLPKDAAQFIAQGLTIHGLNVGSAARDGNVLAHELMGVERGGYYDPDRLAALVEHTPSKALHATLAVVLGGIEASTSKLSWRNPSYRDGLYFTRLAEWGYILSDVEEIIVNAEKREPVADAGDQPDDDLDEEWHSSRRGSLVLLSRRATPRLRHGGRNLDRGRNAGATGIRFIRGSRRLRH